MALRAATLMSLASSATAAKWALLAAGSNSYFNYRHQADICHAYQLMKSHGIPDENIIVMHFDDIANDPENPFPGTLINYPSCVPAAAGDPVSDECNVYLGCPKDYTGATVTAENFLAVMSGDEEKMTSVCAQDGATCNGKVIKATADDEVFVNFSDHGGTGLIAFPAGNYLMADDLVNALKGMAASNSFDQLVFYLEACESGSMFNGLLPDNINIYTTTASTPFESSYGCDCDVAGPMMGTCLNDCYSINWMMDVQNHTLIGDYTFEDDYDLILKETTMSSVCQYGDLSIKDEQMSKFLRGSVAAAVTAKPASARSGKYASVSSRDNTLFHLEKKMEMATNEVEKAAAVAKYMKERKARNDAVEHITAVVKMSAGDKADDIMAPQTPDPTTCYSEATSLASLDFDCYREMISVYEAECGKFTDFSLQFAGKLAKMCQAGVPPSSVAVNAKIVCSQ